jgi:hypothetical protein
LNKKERKEKNLHAPNDDTCRVSLVGVSVFSIAGRVFP